MALTERPIHFHIVTSSPARTNAFASLLGADRVHQVLPHFTEDIIRKPVNMNVAEWPLEMAERKAMQDISALMVRSYINGAVETGHAGDIHTQGDRVIRIYSDTINITYDKDIFDDTAVVNEKPKNIAQWMSDRVNGAMGMSGKNTELCTALTAIDMTDPSVHPTTVLVRTAIKMKPFTIQDVQEFVRKHGADSVLKSASGISFVNDTVELFDTDSPLRTYIQTNPDEPPTLVHEYKTWGHLTHEERLRILYGAVPQAIEQLITNFQPAYPSHQGRSTAERYGLSRQNNAPPPTTPS